MLIFVKLLQKESLGEYGSGWEWDSTYAHVFDQTDVNDTPKQYFSNGTQEGICTNGVDITDGQILYSQSQMFDQMSCKPNVGNAGNYYSFPASTAEGKLSSGNESNSVCPKGWMLTTNSGGDRRSYYNLFATYYGLADITSGNRNDLLIRKLPLIFLRTGYYENSSFANRTVSEVYLSSALYSGWLVYGLSFTSGNHYNFQRTNISKSTGGSVRCVAH